MRSPANPQPPPRSSPLVITIDGPGGSGKSTVAKCLARQLRFAYLDTGATYRMLAYAATQQHLHPVADADRIARLARRLPMTLLVDEKGLFRVRLAGVDVSREIRTEEVTEAAALIAQHPAVRQALVRRQRQLANTHGVVVEGRDTGSVVFPRASFKFFLTASASTRARRRQRELAQMYGSQSPLAQVHEQLRFRDGLDRRRRVGPLVKPAGAITIDTTHRVVGQVVRAMLGHIRKHAASAKPHAAGHKRTLAKTARQ